MCNIQTDLQSAFCDIVLRRTLHDLADDKTTLGQVVADKKPLPVLMLTNFHGLLRDLVGHFSWRRHQMETFSAFLALCAGNSPVTGEFPSQRAVMRSFDAFFDLHLNKQLSKQSWSWWFETPSHSLWRHRNVMISSDQLQRISISLIVKDFWMTVYFCSQHCISWWSGIVW